jgi:hypothetical protein
MGMTHAMPLSRRSALALGAGALAMPLAARAQPAQPVLVELFTSQGCSSCPAADRLAAKLAKQEGVLVVSLNVDYWDYLGWRDTLAKPEYSQRQYDYAKTRGDGSVYTPQMVFNGRTHAVGSSAGKVENHLDLSRKSPLQTALSLRMSKKEIAIDIAEAKSSVEATLWLMAITPVVKQKIERGENAGEAITYINVVRNLVPAAMWQGKAQQGSWPRDAVMTDGSSMLVAVLQQGKTGEVLGVARA